MEQQIFVVTQPVSASWFPGRFVRVSGVTRRTPVPGFVLESCEPYDGPVTGACLEVDAAAVALEQAATAPAPTLSYHIREDAVPAALGINRQQFEAVLATNYFPASDAVAVSGDIDAVGLVRNERSRTRLWRRSDVERFAANARTLAAIFSGKSR